MVVHHVRLEEDGEDLHVYGWPPHLEPVLEAAAAPPAPRGALRKARAPHTHEGPDVRWPDLNVLVDEALKPWERWSRWVTREVAKQAAKAGTMDTVAAGSIADLLRKHRAGVTAETTGHTLDPEVVRGLVRTRDLRKDYPSTALVPQAFGMGLGSDPTEIRRPGQPSPSRGPRDLQELAALAYARDRAAAYMQRPVDALHRAIKGELAGQGVLTDRVLTREERAIVAREVASAVRTGMGPRELAAALRRAAAGTTMTNDMLRVARTELQAALNHGAYAALKAQGPPRGNRKRLVYKQVSPDACEECQRIWGPMDAPSLYPLRAIERWEKAGGNVGKSKADWGPTIGPIHPNCRCGPLRWFDPVIHDQIPVVAAEIRRMFPRS